LAELWKPDDSLDLYGVNRWGRDYFSVNRKGHLVIRPSSTGQNFVDVREIADTLVERGLQSPILLRFPQLIEDRIVRLYNAFDRAKKEYGYKGHLRAVFPMKVNQEKEVIEDIVEYGDPFDYGLEVGSKPELLAALALKKNDRAILVCNGFKDYSFVELACYGSLYRKNVILVIDKLDEVPMIIDAIKATGARPMLGIRMKLAARGGGKWVESGGERAKFGLSVPAILDAVAQLRKAKLISLVKMLHFHIGSQITDIKRIINGLREAARLYAEIVKLKVPLKYFDVGGGMAIDYDGSQSTSSTSCNYDMEEYASSVTYTIMSICDDEGVPHPDIITEAGRGISAYHSMLVARVMEKPALSVNASTIEVEGSDPLPIHELHQSLQEIGPKNYIEEYHDALVHRDDLLSLFNLGQIDIKTRAKGELLFREVCRRCLKFVRREEDLEEFEEELTDLKRLLGHKWVVNFSLFQSTPDVWGVKQLFPVLPIQRLDEEPKETGTLCDLTCDSDGEIKKFIDHRNVKDVLELHNPGEEPYYLAFMLLGAYQDVLANAHNLYGPPDEAFITIKKDGSWETDKIVRGRNAEEMLATMNWDAKELVTSIERIVLEEGPGDGDRGREFLRRFRRTLGGTVYLIPEGSNGAGNL
jgi:arginine decarboxylase